MLETGCEPSTWNSERKIRSEEVGALLLSDAGAVADAVGPLPVGPLDNGLLLPDELPEPLLPDVGEPLVGVPVVPGTIVVVVV